MIANKYGIGFVDSSYIIQRNLAAISRGKKPGEYTAADVIRSTIQTINKINRDYKSTAGCDKFVLLADKWDPEYLGYWRTQLLKGAYKDTRGDGTDTEGKPIYYDMRYYESIKDSPSLTEQEKEEVKEKAYKNEVRSKAKRVIQGELRNFGIPTIGILGWEADDLAYLATGLLYTDDPSVKPNLIITKDTDQQFSISPKVDYFKIPGGKQEPKVITYDEMYATIPDFLKGRISLYNYHAYFESLGDSHNDMRSPRKPGTDVDTTILHILDGDYSDLEDIELFKRNISSFNIGNFPRFEEARRAILDLVPTAGRLGTLGEFHEFCDKHGITGISDKYFTEFISRFDPKLFSER